jgi:hypothetical protein
VSPLNSEARRFGWIVRLSFVWKVVVLIAVFAALAWFAGGHP